MEHFGFNINFCIKVYKVDKMVFKNCINNFSD